MAALGGLLPLKIQNYRIQFGSPLPHFNRIVSTVVGPEQDPLLEQEVNTLLRKKAIEVVLPLDRESGFYSRYFIVPKKDGGLCLILDLHQLNRSVMLLKFKMLTIKQVVSQIRSDQIRLVCHDRSKICVFLCLHPSSTQEVPEVCFRGRSLPISSSSVRPCTLTRNFHKVCGCCSGYTATPGHPHIKLYQRWVDSSSIRVDDSSTLRCRSRPYDRVGVKLGTKRQEKYAFCITEDHLYGRGVGFKHDAGTAVSCSDRVDTHCSRESQRRLVTQCLAVSKIDGSDGNYVQRDTFWSAVYETLTVVAQDQGVLPEGKSALHDQGHTVILSCLRHVEKTLVLVTGFSVGSS